MKRIQVGETLGRYDLLEELGQGGMSIVFRARDQKLKRDVALKVMHAFLAEQSEARQRFHREAVAVARLRHPHIIEIYDYSAEGTEEAYIVAELVEGHSLAGFLDEHPTLLPEAALLLARPIADALSHAHDEGIVHRDLKPENILIDNRGTLKLTDFGIARILDDQSLTMTGTLLGSPAYMAPEYIEGEPSDARADIFSLGAMLYRIITGSLPFAATSPHAVLKRIATGAYRPIDQVEPSVHRTLADIVQRCLARNPDERYASAQTLVEDIDRFLNTLNIDPEAERPQLLGNPSSYCDALAERLVHTYAALGKDALAEKENARAIAHFDRVLSLEPEHEEVRALLQRMTRQASLGRALRRGMTASLVIMAVVALVAFWPEERIPDPTPLSDEQASPLPGDSSSSSFPKEDQTPKRNVIFSLTGSGALSVDGSTVRSPASGTVALMLREGKHQIRFSGAGQALDKTIDIPATGPIPVVHLELSKPKVSREISKPPGTSKTSEKQTPAEERSKEIAIVPIPMARLFIDGSPKAHTTTDPLGKKTDVLFRETLVRLRYGKHTLHFTHESARAVDVVVQVGENSPPGDRVLVKLQPLPARLVLKGQPPGLVEILLDGSSVGFRSDANANEPIIVPLESFSKRTKSVQIMKKGYLPFRQNMRFSPGKAKVLEVQLQPI